MILTKIIDVYETCCILTVMLNVGATSSDGIALFICIWSNLLHYYLATYEYTIQPSTWT